MPLGNPGPLGLLSFGVTTTYLGLHFFDLYSAGNILYAGAFFLGGCLQAVAGVLEFFVGNTFGATAFLSYGCFWIALKFGEFYNSKAASGGPGADLGGSFDLFFFLLTALMSVATLFSRMNKLMSVLFIDVSIVFLILALEALFGIDADIVGIVKGVLGTFGGVLAMYIAMAEVFELEAGREVLPLFKKRAA
eukprot:gnl/Chilomastix_cuspidata/1205.p1 GENE.gnl/Chilomastix_cuspidata/1205~~gnl/Chilomastix_cuspidata/1205.p1  ORF type:complete len:192 (+),score=84.84 gnl/Chilomastix_cuspidata/1205:56-631(+)